VRYEFDRLSECGVTRPMIHSNIKRQKGLQIGVHGCLVSFVVGVADSMISDQSIADQCISANRSEKSAAFCSKLLIEGLGLFSSLLMVVSSTFEFGISRCQLRYSAIDQRVARTARRCRRLGAACFVRRRSVVAGGSRSAVVCRRHDYTVT